MRLRKKSSINEIKEILKTENLNGYINIYGFTNFTDYKTHFSMPRKIPLSNMAELENQTKRFLSISNSELQPKQVCEVAGFLYFDE